MGAINITGKTMGSTQATLTAGTINRNLPITVKSTNLLAYGPATGNGLTATVNTDGKLTIAGSVEAQQKGLHWTSPLPSDVKGKTVTYKGTAPTGMYSYVAFLTSDGLQVGDLALNGPVTVPTNAASFDLRLLTGGAYTPGTVINGTFDPRLSLGDTALDWMKPDDTTLQGGGGELANLWPVFASGSYYGVECKAENGSYTLTGTTTQWGGIYKDITLEAGHYTLSKQGADIKVTLQYPPASPTKTYNAPASFTLDVPTLVRCQLTLEPSKTYAGTITPFLYKL